MKKIKVISCVTTVAIMALIFFFSSQTSDISSQTSMSITKIIAEFIANIFNIDDVTAVAVAIHTIVRKTAHFTMFFLLGLSVTNTILQCFGLEKLKLFLIAIAFCLIYAISDEVHQLFVSGRAAQVRDVMIDFCGSISGSGIFIIIRNLFCRRARK